MTTKNIKLWLSYLQNTVNFESAFSQVFKRVIHGNGNGLIILQGPSKIANKSFFLNLVGAFQKGVHPSVRGYFPSNFSRLLDDIDASSYQCVNIKNDCPPQVTKTYGIVYRVPLYMALPFSLTSASQMRGLKKGSRIVVLCDDLNEFIPHNKESNMTFLKQLAVLLFDQKDLTFVAAYQTSGYNNEGLENTDLSIYCLPVGYD
jgi:hypothetical protein